MENRNSFFIPKIERLVEGLPGTEFAPSYVFHAYRSASGGNQAWIHEAKIRHQKQHHKKQEKARKATKQGDAKAKVEEERVSNRLLPHWCHIQLVCLRCFVPVSPNELTVVVHTASRN